MMLVACTGEGTGGGQETWSGAGLRSIQRHERRSGAASTDPVEIRLQSCCAVTWDVLRCAKHASHNRRRRQSALNSAPLSQHTAKAGRGQCRKTASPGSVPPRARNLATHCSSASFAVGVRGRALPSVERRLLDCSYVARCSGAATCGPQQ
jgi:hypothetical protein